MKETGIKISLKNFVLYFFLVIFCACNQQAEEATTGALLWKISGNGLKQPSYLLGTMHVIPWEFFYQIPGAEDAFNSCEAFISEVSEDEPDVSIYKDLPDSISFLDLYSSDELEFILLRLNPNALDYLLKKKPYTIALSIVINDYAEVAGEAGVRLDTYIEKLAKAKGKYRYALETPAFQDSLLYNSYSIKDGAKFLLDLIKEREEIQTYQAILQEGIDAYLRYDLDYHFRELCKDEDESDSLGLTNRNNNWMKKIPGLIQKQSCFIAVGYAHLPQSYGLLPQLREAGYRVEAEKCDNWRKSLSPKAFKTRISKKHKTT